MNEENSFEEKPLANLNDLIFFIILLPKLLIITTYPLLDLLSFLFAQMSFFIHFQDFPLLKESILICSIFNILQKAQ
jgi:hypothetical protein